MDLQQQARHEVNASTNLLPPLAAEDRERLSASIAEHGFWPQSPVEVDESGQILDGFTRAEIAWELGIEYPTTVVRGLSAHEKRVYAVTRNLARRQLTDAQKVQLGREIEPDIAALAEERQKVGKVQDNCPGGQTRDEVAKTVGLGSGKTYERGKKALAQAEQRDPTITERVKTGEATMRDVRQIAEDDDPILAANRKLYSQDMDTAQTAAAPETRQDEIKQDEIVAAWDTVERAMSVLTRHPIPEVSRLLESSTRKLTNREAYFHALADYMRREAMSRTAEYEQPRIALFESEANKFEGELWKILSHDRRELKARELFKWKEQLAPLTRKELDYHLLELAKRATALARFTEHE